MYCSLVCPEPLKPRISHDEWCGLTFPRLILFLKYFAKQNKKQSKDNNTKLSFSSGDYQFDEVSQHRDFYSTAKAMQKAYQKENLNLEDLSLD